MKSMWNQIKSAKKDDESIQPLITKNKDIFTGTLETMLEKNQEYDHSDQFALMLKKTDHNIHTIKAEVHCFTTLEQNKIKQIKNRLKNKKIEEIPENIEEIPENVSENVEEIPENIEEIPENVSKNIEEIPENGKITKTVLINRDLLKWCKKVTKDYPDIKIVDFSTSWRNGMAFCAIIHHFKPYLIDMDNLRPSDIKENCTKAIDVAEKFFNIPKIINLADMVISVIPDETPILIFVNALRVYFTHTETNIQINHQKNEIKLDSYTVGMAGTNHNYIFNREITDMRRRNQIKQDKIKQIYTSKNKEMLDLKKDLYDKYKHYICKQLQKVNNVSLYNQRDHEILEKELSETNTLINKLELRLQRATEINDNVEFKNLMDIKITLVNKKNTILRKQMQMNILEKNHNFEEQYEVISEELRNNYSIKEWQKTPSHKQHEVVLLETLVEIVNKRNEMVQQLDIQKNEIKIDKEIEQKASTYTLNQDNVFLKPFNFIKKIF